MSINVEKKILLGLINPMKEIIYFCSVQLEMQDAIFLAFENRLSTHTLNCWKQREKIAYYIWPGSDLLQIGPLKSDRNWTITQAASPPHKNNYEIFFKFGAKSFMKSYFLSFEIFKQFDKIQSCKSMKHCKNVNAIP